MLAFEVVADAGEVMPLTLCSPFMVEVVWKTESRLGVVYLPPDVLAHVPMHLVVSW